MGRRQANDADWSRAERLGRALQALRKGRSTTQAHLASLSGVSVDTVRKLEQGGVAYPALFIVSAVVGELGGSLDELVDAIEDAP